MLLVIGSGRYVLHNSHNCSLDTEPSRVVILLLGFASLTIALDLVAAADDTNLDLDEFALETFVEGESVGRFHILGHGLLDQDARLGRYGKRLQVSDVITRRNIGPSLDLLKSQAFIRTKLVEQEKDDHAICRYIQVVATFLERSILLGDLGEDSLDVRRSHIGEPSKLSSGVLLAVELLEAAFEFVYDKRVVASRSFILFVCGCATHSLKRPCHAGQDIDG